MNDPRLTSLIQSHLDGLLSVDEERELSDWLCHSESARQQFWELASLHGALHEVAKTVLPINLAVAERLPAPPRRLNLRPHHRAALVAALAGLMIGLSGASLVYAYVMPRLVVTTERLQALRDGSFESPPARLPLGFPQRYGEWSGDEATTVELPGAVNGRQALRFDRAGADPGVPNSPAKSCDVYQLVDLRRLKVASTDGEAILELRAQVLDGRAAAGEPIKLSCRVYVFSGSAEALRSEWPLSRLEAIAMGSSELHSDGGDRQWRGLAAGVLMPPGADFAVVQFVAGKTGDANSPPAVFGEQYLDDVRLTLKKQPVLPNQVAQSR